MNFFKRVIFKNFIKKDSFLWVEANYRKSPFFQDVDFILSWSIMDNSKKKFQKLFLRSSNGNDVPAGRPDFLSKLINLIFSDDDKLFEKDDFQKLHYTRFISEAQWYLKDEVY